MKSHKLSIILIGILAVLALAFSGCDAGISKEDRIESFKADIRAGANTRDNFRGHPNASTIGPSTFTETGVSIGECEDGVGGAFLGGDSIGDTFTIYYENIAGASLSASGTFHSEKNGMGEDWYIYQITVDSVTRPN